MAWRRGLSESRREAMRKRLDDIRDEVARLREFGELAEVPVWQTVKTELQKRHDDLVQEMYTSIDPARLTKCSGMASGIRLVLNLVSGHQDKINALLGELTELDDQLGAE